jgi:putative ABC transport system substrate-binding protein
MKRREFITGLLAAASMTGAQAQSKTQYRIAVVHPSTPIEEMRESSSDPFYRPFFQELRRLGYIEGETLVVDRYSAEGRAERFSQIAQDAISKHPSVIFAASSRIVLHLKEVTSTIPIVGAMADPIAYGIVSNLARPEANITGATADAGLEIWGKRIELIREMIPDLSKIGILTTQALQHSSTRP